MGDGTKPTKRDVARLLSQRAAIEWRSGDESNELHDLLREGRDEILSLRQQLDAERTRREAAERLLRTWRSTFHHRKSTRRKDTDDYFAKYEPKEGG